MKYKVTKTIDFGSATIGDANYGPNCKSCTVPINNYAPKVGDVLEGSLVQITQGGPKGLIYKIRTNGAASTQGQSSDQFITEDKLEEVVVSSEPQKVVCKMKDGSEGFMYTSGFTAGVCIPKYPTGLKGNDSPIGVILLIILIVFILILIFK